MTDLFNEDPKENAQNAVSQAPASKAKPEPTIKTKQKKKYEIKDYLWLAGLILGGGAILYFLNASDAPHTSNSTGGVIQSRHPAASTSASGDDGAVSSSFREEISGAVLKQDARINDIDSTSKQGLTVLSNQLRTANKEIASLKQQMQKMQLSGISNENVSSKYGANDYAFNQQPKKLLTEFSINDLSNELAWVKYKNQVYAMRNGSVLGGVTVIAIDVNHRLVETDKGLIR